MEHKAVNRLRNEVPDAIYESMLKIFIRLALKKHGQNLKRAKRKHKAI